MEGIRIVDEITEKEILISYLERAREEWLPHHRRAVRAGGWNAEANLAAAEALKPIDILLDDLGALAVKQTVVQS